MYTTKIMARFLLSFSRKVELTTKPVYCIIKGSNSAVMAAITVVKLVMASGA